MPSSRWTCRIVAGSRRAETSLALGVVENMPRPSRRFVTTAKDRSVWYSPPTGWVTALAGLLACGSAPERPAFPVSQWLTRATGSPLTVAGAATAPAKADPCSLLPPRLAPENQHAGEEFLAPHIESRTGPRVDARVCQFRHSGS